MSAKDIYHNAVAHSLVKWKITHDPLHLKFGGFDFFIDLGAENLIGARKENRLIAVEVKSFVGTSSLNEFHKTDSGICPRPRCQGNSYLTHCSWVSTRKEPPIYRVCRQLKLTFVTAVCQLIYDS